MGPTHFLVRFLGIAKTGAVREGKDTPAGFRQKLVELLLGVTGRVNWGKIYTFPKLARKFVNFWQLYVTYLYLWLKDVKDVCSLLGNMYAKTTIGCVRSLPWNSKVVTDWHWISLTPLSHSNRWNFYFSGVQRDIPSLKTNPFPSPAGIFELMIFFGSQGTISWLLRLVHLEGFCPVVAPISSTELEGYSSHDEVDDLPGPCRCRLFIDNLPCSKSIYTRHRLAVM